MALRLSLLALLLPALSSCGLLGASLLATKEVASSTAKTTRSLVRNEPLSSQGKNEKREIQQQKTNTFP